jgi:predicted nucleotidyltransferase
MRRVEALDRLSEYRDEIRACGVKSLLLFGSVARDEARPDSDIDLLVEFEPSVGLFEVVRFQNYLEGILGQRVDLVLHDAIKQQLRDRIMKDVVRAA